MRKAIVTLANKLRSKVNSLSEAFKLAWKLWRLSEALKNNWVVITYKKVSGELTERTACPTSEPNNKPFQFAYCEEGGRIKSFRAVNLISYRIAEGVEFSI